MAPSVPAVEHQRLDSPSVGRVDPGIDGGARLYGHADTATHRRYVGRAPAVPQRWRIDAPTVDQHEKADDGEWMRAEDVLPLLERLGDRDQLRDALGRLSQELNTANEKLRRLEPLASEAAKLLEQGAVAIREDVALIRKTGTVVEAAKALADAFDATEPRSGDVGPLSVLLVLLVKAVRAYNGQEPGGQ